MAENYLVDQAIRKVWCTPDQDKQVIFKPARISKVDGVRTWVRVMWRNIDLPTNELFHVFQIGQIYFSTLNLLPESEEWVLFSDACNDMKLLAEIYTTNGVRMPLHRCYYRKTEDRDLIIAVPYIQMVPAKFGAEDLYVHLYSNAYFNSVRSDSSIQAVHVEGATPTTLDELLTVQRTVTKYRQLSGTVMTFVNGYLTSGIDPFTAKVGDTVEFIYDSSVDHVVDVPISSLQTFVSSKDSERKYLLHPPIVVGEEKVIRYYDDNTHFIYQADPAGRFKGVYYHLNRPEAVRMVTHRDYSLIVNNVLTLGKFLDASSNTLDMTVRIYIRKSGYDRALVYEASKIHELYKLSDDLIVRSLVGLDSDVSVWQAPNLESAGYPAVMGSATREMGVPLVESMFGYDSIAQMLGYTPQTVYTKSNQQVVDVPYGLQQKSVGFEYDSNGALIGAYQHSLNDVYVCSNHTAFLVELINGQLSKGFHEIYDDTFTIDSTLTYRYYLKNISTGKWTDVTGGQQYSIVNGQMVWTVDKSKFTPMVRSDMNVVFYSFDRQPYNGPIEFNLQQSKLVNGVATMVDMEVPPGELNIWLNGRELACNLDYFIEFPKVVVINKEYLIDPLGTMQHFDVRAKGFCDSSLTLEANDDTGFVQYGLLSRNNKFDLRDDQVQHVIVNGYLYAKNELRYFENNSSVSVGNALEGKPYFISDIVVPTRGLTSSDTYALKTISDATNASVSAFLTKKLPEYVPENPSPITERYFVFSPFCCRLLYDLKREEIARATIRQRYTDDLLAEICAPYLYLLDFDPVSDANAQDSNFVYVQPHNLTTVIDLDIYQYTILANAVRVYLKDRITLSDFVTVSSAT